MFRWILLIAGIVCLPTLAGCGWMRTPKFHTPTLAHPGTATQQQGMAVRHDPYPLDDLGPEIVGGRPRGFQKPPSEVARVRQGQPWTNWQGHQR